MSTLKGVDPNGSQRAWDLYREVPLPRHEEPGPGAVLASGTPITNTLGEMFTLQRYPGHEALRERGLHEFDAWASTFGDTTHRTRVAAVRQLQAGDALRRVRQRRPN